MGDAGALVTDDEELADRALSLREHGQRRSTCTRRRDTRRGSTRSRRSSCSASCRCSNAGTTRRRQSRRAISKRWRVSAIFGFLRFPRAASPSGTSSSFGPPIRTHWRRTSAERGIQSGRHYPPPVHLTEAYAHLGYGEGAFPVAESFARECLSLPIFPGMHEAEIAQVIAAIAEFFEHG